MAAKRRPPEDEPASRLDLDALEKRSQRRYDEDGLWDVQLGLLLLVIVAVGWGSTAPDPFPTLTTTLVILGPLSIGGVGFLRSRLLKKRLGSAVPGAKQKRRDRLLLISMAVIFGLFVAVPAVWGSLAGHDVFPVAVFASYVAFGFAMAIFKHVPRYFVYGILLGAGWTALLVFGDEDWGAVLLLAGLPALAMIASGLAILSRFLRRYPAPDVGELPDGDR